jgi:hypothetical protein
MAWGEKAWQYTAFISDDAFVAAAIAHLGYLGFAFAYVVDRRSGRQTGFQAITPLAFGAEVAPSPDSGKSVFYHPSGYILMENRPRRLSIRLKEFRCDAALEEIKPFDATWPIQDSGYNRTQKAMGLPCEATLIERGAARTLAGHCLSDWTRGTPARETAWGWSAGVGTAGGRLVAWNLRTGFDDPSGAENCVWVACEPRCYDGPAEIDLPAEGAKAWAMRYGDLTVSFEEEGERHENLDLILVASRYRQPFGRYTGTFQGDPLVGFGVAEDHWARW